MKKEQFKKALKPLIKECIKEVMFEDGVLSGIITEVARGMAESSPAPAAPAAPPSDPVVDRLRRNAFNKEESGRLQEHKKKLMSAIGSQSYNGVNLFEGTNPAASESRPEQQASPISGIAAADPGVDISGLFGAVGGHWGAHMNNVEDK